MSKGEISHRGKIIHIGPQTIIVEIISKSACSSCNAAGLCNMSEAVKKEIEIKKLPDFSFKVGQEVEVIMTNSTGFKAVLISYVLPLIILMILILSLSLSGINELISGLTAIGGVGLYYFAIWLLKDKIANECCFYIKD